MDIYLRSRVETQSLNYRKTNKQKKQMEFRIASFICIINQKMLLVLFWDVWHERQRFLGFPCWP